jgi:hypothetical protein
VTIDASADWVLGAGVDYALGLVLQGTTATVTVDGSTAVGFSYNAPVLDGSHGTLVSDGSGSFDSVRVRTNDPAFAGSPPPLSAVEVGDAWVNEGPAGTGTTVYLSVTLDAAADTTTTVDWTTADGTGTAGSDYAPASGTITFAADDTEAQIAVTVFGDDALEPDESFQVLLSNAVGIDLADAFGSVTIVGTALPSLSVADASAVEGRRGTTAVAVTVTLSSPSSTIVMASIATVAGGTATAGEDYEPGAATLTFAPGETTQTFLVSVIGDRVSEADETILVALSDSVGAGISQAVATVTILDDEKALTASTTATGPVPVAPLSTSEAAPMLRAATDILAPAGAEAHLLEGVSLQVIGLSGGLLAVTAGSTIYLDADAAGWGWFVDTTPNDHSEFTGGPGGDWTARAESAAAGRMDLLTVILHELDHVLGLDHGVNLSDVPLDAGTRRLPVFHSGPQPAGAAPRFSLDVWEATGPAAIMTTALAASTAPEPPGHDALAGDPLTGRLETLTHPIVQHVDAAGTWSHESLPAPSAQSAESRADVTTAFGAAHTTNAAFTARVAGADARDDQRLVDLEVSGDAVAVETNGASSGRAVELMLAVLMLGVLAGLLARLSAQLLMKSSTAGTGRCHPVRPPGPECH